MAEESRPIWSSRSARPLLSADGVYSAGRNGERFLKEGLGEDCHKRDGERFPKEGLDEDCHKRDGERLAKKRLNKGAEKR